MRCDAILRFQYLTSWTLLLTSCGLQAKAVHMLEYAGPGCFALPGLLVSEKPSPPLGWLQVLSCGPNKAGQAEGQREKIVISKDGLVDASYHHHDNFSVTVTEE